MVIHEAPWYRAESPYAPPIGATQRALQADVVLGVTSQRCAGNGICRMYTLGQIGRERAHVDFAPAVLYADEQENLILRLDRKRMRRRTLERHLSGLFFEMEEDFALPAFVREELYLQRTLLPAGFHASFAFDRYQYIVFPAEAG